MALGLTRAASTVHARIFRVERLLSRRSLGAAALGLAVSGMRSGAHAAQPDAGAPPAPAPLSVRVATLAGRRVLLAVPASAPSPLRVAILLHGLGEAYDPLIGARAWADRYGLIAADARLRHPPVAATAARGDLPIAEVSRINADLGSSPFAELAYACPHMPVPVTAAYAQWLAHDLVPALRVELPSFTGEPVLGGCSLGGRASISAVTAYPATFPFLACTQAAISVDEAPRMAGDLVSAGVRKMYVATSSGDPYREANGVLARSLARLGADVVTRSFPGPHDQPWLREVGTLDLVLWASRSLR